MAAAHNSRQKMWKAIENMGKDFQELAQGDAGTDEEDTIEQVPTSWRKAS